MVIFDCRTSYYTTIPECWNSIIVNIGLPPGDYWYNITTPYGKVYTKQVHVESLENGFTLLAVDFPEGLFNPYIGFFELRIFGIDGCSLITLDICEQNYQSVIIKPTTIYGQPEEDVRLVCPCTT